MSSIHVHSQRETRTGICIVWPAWFPGSTDPELHATALFLGHTDTVDYSKEDVERHMGTPYLWPSWVYVTGQDWFGRNKDVPVLTLERRNLMLLTRDSLKRHLERVGILANTDFAFNPHVTVAKELDDLVRPDFIHLESPVLWWGADRPLHSAHADRKAA